LEEGAHLPKIALSINRPMHTAHLEIPQRQIALNCAGSHTQKLNKLHIYDKKETAELASFGASFGVTFGVTD